MRRTIGWEAAAMNVLLLSMPDSFEHMAPVAVRMPNGALASLAGHLDPHHRVAVADLILAQRTVAATVERLLREHQPDVVIFDISPPYLENWQFFKTLRDGGAMAGRGLVLTTTNKERLDETVGADSGAFEIVGKPYDLEQIKAAIQAALTRAHQLKQSVH